ncbi:MAG: DUF885 domain-containing protein, partial [Proteobacteria bacterium]
MPRPIAERAIVFALAWLLTCAPMRAAASGSADGLDSSGSELRPLIERYTEDRNTLSRVYDGPLSPVRRARYQQLYEEWLRKLEKSDFDSLSQDGKIDYLLLQNHLHYQLRQLGIREKQEAEMAPLLPFAQIIVNLDEARRKMELPRPQEAAAALVKMTKQIADTRQSAEAGLKTDAELKQTKSEVAPIRAPKTVARRAAATVAALRETLTRWFKMYGGYDPVFTWWVAEPYKEADQALEGYGNFLKEKLVGIKPDDKVTIIGDPVGRQAMIAEIEAAMIPYTPEELIALAKNEMAWCTKEMLGASREMGYGDDWHKALEHVKDMHVEPGQQPEMVRNLALEGIDYVESHDLVTVPPLAKETWRMTMLSPEQQLVSPFFLGGEVIQVSFPTDTMTFEQRMMSMRGNNIPFSRSTVFHELIPGHWLQQFMSERYRPYRGIFHTPFWTEGNAFYWEMLLWDRGFPRTPEERVGMLFWRMHRCARIIFSLSFHLGLMTPLQCVDFLVKNVGHEPDNAAAEVRRSFDGSYGPLYQCAYMLGALQFRALHQELVDSGKMTNREFHDAILEGNQMPVEMVRASLTG